MEYLEQILIDHVTSHVTNLAHPVSPYMVVHQQMVCAHFPYIYKDGTSLYIILSLSPSFLTFTLCSKLFLISFYLMFIYLHMFYFICFILCFSIFTCFILYVLFIC